MKKLIALPNLNRYKELHTLNQLLLGFINNSAPGFSDIIPLLETPALAANVRMPLRIDFKVNPPTVNRHLVTMANQVSANLVRARERVPDAMDWLVHVENSLQKHPIFIGATHMVDFVNAFFEKHAPTLICPEDKKDLAKKLVMLTLTVLSFQSRKLQIFGALKTATYFFEFKPRPATERTTFRRPEEVHAWQARVRKEASLHKWFSMMFRLGLLIMVGALFMGPKSLDFALYALTLMVMESGSLIGQVSPFLDKQIGKWLKQDTHQLGLILGIEITGLAISTLHKGTRSTVDSAQPVIDDINDYQLFCQIYNPGQNFTRRDIHTTYLEIASRTHPDRFVGQNYSFDHTYFTAVTEAPGFFKEHALHNCPPLFSPFSAYASEFLWNKIQRQIYRLMGIKP